LWSNTASDNASCRQDVISSTSDLERCITDLDFCSANDFWMVDETFVKLDLRGKGWQWVQRCSSDGRSGRSQTFVVY
jgi:hypothetical protein